MNYAGMGHENVAGADFPSRTGGQKMRTRGHFARLSLGTPGQFVSAAKADERVPSLGVG